MNTPMTTGHQVARSQSVEPGVELVEQGSQPSNRQVDELLDGRGGAGEDAAVDISRPLAPSGAFRPRVYGRAPQLGGRSIGVELSMKF